MDIRSVNLIDFILGLVILLSVIAGLFRGAIRQALDLGTVAVSAVAAGRIYHIVTGFLTGSFPALPQSGLWAFLITYTVAHVLVAVLASMLFRSHNWPVMGCPGELGGGVLGVATGVVGATVLAAVFGTFPIWGLADLVHQSWLAGFLFSRTGLVRLLLPPEFQLVTNQVWALAHSTGYSL